MGVDVISDTTGKAILEELKKRKTDDSSISIKSQISDIADQLEILSGSSETAQKATIDENGTVQAQATIDENGIITIPNATIDENGIVTI